MFLVPRYPRLMSNLFEDYREIKNVRDKVDLLIELVSSAPRRVFLTELGEVKAVVIGVDDYEDLWKIELERDMKLTDEDVVHSNEDVIRRMNAFIATGKLELES
jgi:hypothetical protein